MPGNQPKRLLFLALVLAVGLSACAGLDEWTAGQAGTSDSARIAEGLREALRVGSERAGTRLAREDAYFGDPRFRIGLPDQLESAATQLRRIGLGGRIDQLELAMNRAAEAAAAEAVGAFAAAIRQMQPADVQAVFRGGDDAATRYLRRNAESSLQQRYQPIVRRQLEQVRGLEYYRDLAQAWNRLPGVEPLEADLDRWVTEQALDGLFLALAEEEARIRHDPVARTTELLRQVFGRD
jgi:hypothetical protein